MNMEEKIAFVRENIYGAIHDYGLHTSSNAILNDVSDCFVERLARDSVYAKAPLREMFRKSPAWDEKLDALIINGTRTHNPNYELINNLAHKILNSVTISMSSSEYDLLGKALRLFTEPDTDKTESIEALNIIAPKSYAPRKKLSRVFKALCTELGVVDETPGSEFQRLYAQLADELSSKKISFKLFVSLNPAHFITMSNPINDKRGETMTSCHSFNRTDYPYNNGCSGYARDSVTMIAFTASDPNIRETLNNRKTTRQLFMYQPGNGLLLQSRMYNTSGGTHGAQAESKVYRDLIQREISACENAPNLWKTFRYYNNDKCVYLDEGDGFRGYPDWIYSDFNAVVSIRNDHADNYKLFKIGTYGLCIMCGDLCSSGLYCSDCEDKHCHCCEECGDYFDECEMAQVYNRYGDPLWVCENCRDNYYTYCDHCDRYYPNDIMTRINNDCYVCEDCLRSDYNYCEECEKYYHNDYISYALDADGQEICVCDSCRENSYVLCEDCNIYVHEEIAVHIHSNGDEYTVCPTCAEHYKKCVGCDEYQSKLNEDGLCPDCANKKEDDE